MTEKRDILWHQGLVTSTERQTLLGYKPLSLWFTGLSGAGKSTLAYTLERNLFTKGLACVVLDGDNLRQGLNRDLGFSQTDRRENIRRVAEVARLINDNGLLVITSFISPFRDDRAMAKAIIGESRFVEIYLSTSLEACEHRDTKGLYRKARAKEIPEFTGISSPYEPPENAALTIDTATLSIDSCVATLVEMVINLLDA